MATTPARWRMVFVRSPGSCFAVVFALLLSLFGNPTLAGQDPVPLQAGATFRDCSDCPEMVVIPSGEFMMGSRDEDAERMIASPELAGNNWLMRNLVQTYFNRTKPRHSVAINGPFALGKYLVTRGEFAEFVRKTGFSTNHDCYVYAPGSRYGSRRTTASWQQPGIDQSDRDPVVCVNWRDVAAYLAWLNDKTKAGADTESDGPYRLPSESEWEYAARAATLTAHWWGDALGSNNANCLECGSIWDGRRTSPVGSFHPNPFGLYDMLGDAGERVRDCWHPNYVGAPADGSAWMTGDCTSHPTRGDTWFGSAWGLIPVFRLETESDRRSNGTGFRVAKTLPFNKGTTSSHQ